MRQFYRRLEKCILSARKTHVHKIPRFRGGGVFWVLGRGECRFYFYGRADFSELSGTGDSQRDSRKSIRANHSQLEPLFL